MTERIPDQKFTAGIKAIMRRDLFPELKNDAAVDETIKPHSLNTYCATYSGKKQSEFMDSIEVDRKRLRSAAPSNLLDRVEDNTKFNPWPRTQYNALFFEPPTINVEQKKALTYIKKKKPSINYQMTRFPDGLMNPVLQNYPAYHPFTTESSTTESESEFEGRTVFRNVSILQNVQNAKKALKEKREKHKKSAELTQQGRDLLKAMQTNE